MLKPEQVADYLKQNPAFIDNHLELIGGPDAGDDSTPFHERQLNVLRERHAAQLAKYEQVVDSARNNRDLEKSLHGLSIALLGSPTRGQKAANQILCQHFNLAHARVVGPDQTREFIEDADEQSDDVALLRKRVAHGSSICDDRVATDLLRALFEKNDNEEEHGVASCAFIPLGDSDSVLVLGASEPERFQPGMGPIYLDRIGELIAAFLSVDGGD